MLFTIIAAKQAEELATEFLRQSYSVIKTEKSALEDDRVWAVEILVSSLDGEKKITVQVNARTGMILGWNQSHQPT